MPREGTRSATGNSRPRVFQAVDTAPAIKRTNKPKAKKPVAEPTTVNPVKPVGVTKKKPTQKKDGPVAKAKVKAAAKKVEAKVKKVAAKPKTVAPATTSPTTTTTAAPATVAAK
ncbi:hypothetical protein F5Y03DRAFT_126813 [Xylaria venustula]|nr:hypothetical protein F5Y03DRAFT_126813 [Xylaria venustula]